MLGKKMLHPTWLSRTPLFCRAFPHGVFDNFLMLRENKEHSSEALFIILLLESYERWPWYVAS
jgi:hypothetical protein